MQSKKHSILESVTNVTIGIIITLVFSPLIYSLCGMKYTWSQIGWVTAIFTLLSIARSYVIRRIFNNRTDVPRNKEEYSPYCSVCEGCGEEGCCSPLICSQENGDYCKTYLADLKFGYAMHRFFYDEIHEDLTEEQKNRCKEEWDKNYENFYTNE